MTAMREARQPQQPSSDGYAADGLLACEFCERMYASDPSLWVSRSGSMVSCLHCAMHDTLVAAPFDAAAVLEAERMRDEADRLVGGLRGYLRRCLRDHRTASCWIGPRCLLCAASAAGASPSARATLDPWLLRLGYTTAPARRGARAVADFNDRPEASAARTPSKRELAAWSTLDRPAQIALVTAAIAALHERTGQRDRPFFVLDDEGPTPGVLFAPAAIALRVVPANRAGLAPFLLSRTLVTVEQAARLGIFDGPVPEQERSSALAGPRIDLLPRAWRGGLRLPTEAEWAAAARLAQTSALDLDDLGRGLDELIGVERAHIETVRLGPRAKLLRSDYPISTLGERDAIGREAPIRTPSSVGLRVAVSLVE
jgi:hypothetical protein